MELQILKFNFLLAAIGGFWRPLHWTSRNSKLLYNLWIIVSMYLFMIISVSHWLYFIIIVKTLEERISNSFLSVSFANVWVKIFTFLIRRNEIVTLIEIIQGEPCKPCDEEEINIQMTYDRAIRSYSMPYIILCLLSGINVIIGATDCMLNGIIPFGLTWVPWDTSSTFIFIITSFQEIAGGYISIIVNVMAETTVMGFCVQVCARFEILKHRIQKMIKQTAKEGFVTRKASLNKRSRFSKHVSHHLRIIRLAEMVNNTFNVLIFNQFFTSITVLCTCIYHMYFDKTSEDDKSVTTLAVFSLCMFMQIYYYCWGGNEVTVKSAEFGNDMYNTDWIYLPISEQKDLLMIMKRSAKPLKFSSSFLVTLSVESFSNLLKASFSIFNVMHQL